MYAFANQPVQFLHVRLVGKHLQVLADNIFVIPYGRPRLRKTRFEFHAPLRAVSSIKGSITSKGSPYFFNNPAARAYI